MDTGRWTAFNIAVNQFMKTNDRKQLFEDMEDVFNKSLDEIREIVFSNGWEEEFRGGNVL